MSRRSICTSGLRLEGNFVPPGMQATTTMYQQRRWVPLFNTYPGASRFGPCDTGGKNRRALPFSLQLNGEAGPTPKLLFTTSHTNPGTIQQRRLGSAVGRELNTPEHCM